MERTRSSPDTRDATPITLCEDLVAGARAAGADEAEAYFVGQTTTTIDLRDGIVEALVSAAGRGVGLRVQAGGLGYAYSSDLSRAGLAELTERAVRLAGEATPDPDRALPEARPPSAGELRIFDPALAEVSTERKIELLRELEREVRGTDGRVKDVDLARYADRTGSYTLVSSRGVAASYAASGCYAMVIPIARQGDEAQRGYAVTAGHGLADLDVRDAARRAVRRATASLGGRPVPTQRASVVLEPEVVAELLRGVGQALSGEAVLKGRSILVGRQLSRIGSPLVTLADDGSLPGGYASAPVDGEGVPTGRTVLVRSGVLQGLLHSTYTARRAGARSTGNAVRGSYRSLPEVGLTNLQLEPGPDSPEALIAGVDRGLYVVVTRNVGGINPVSGDYSVGASGRWIERGELAGPVSRVTIAAPVLEMLANMSAVGSDLRWVPGQGAIGAPTVRIDGLTIGGR